MAHGRAVLVATSNLRPRRTEESSNQQIVVFIITRGGNASVEISAAVSEAKKVGKAEAGAPWWETKTLDQMTEKEWESLCDGCARCCLVKLQDEDTDEIHLTRLACKLLDVRSCRCSDYANRFKRMDDCVNVDLAAVRRLSWLPESCAYRRIEEGRGLAWWHPLVSGTQDTVHEAGISVRGWARSEGKIKFENYHRYIIPDFETGE